MRGSQMVVKPSNKNSEIDESLRMVDESMLVVQEDRTPIMVKELIMDI